MDILGKKTKKKLAELEVKVEADLKAMKEQYEKKGYMSSNEYNEYFKQQILLLNSAVKLIDFEDVSREKLVKFYETNAQVRGIVNLIANSVAELAEYIELVDKNEKLVEKHWTIDLLNKPNDRFNKRQFVKAWAVNRLLTGDAFVYGEQGVGLSRKNPFSSLYVMNSQDVEIIKGGLTKPIVGYKLKGFPDLDTKLTPENVMFSFEYNTKSDTFYGLSPLKSAANYVQLLEAGLLRQNTAINNGGAANAITPKPDQYGAVSEQQADKAENDLNSKKNVNKNKFVRVPLEVHKLGDKPTDLGILETSKDATMALCFVYNIPIDIYLGQAKYENTKEAKKAIYEQAAIPLMNELLQDLASFFKLDKEGLNYILNTDKVEVLKKSATDSLNALTLMNASINDKRELMGYPRIEKPYADQPIIPMGVMLGYEDVPDIDESEN